MSETDKFAAESPTETAELREQVNSLQSTLSLTLVLMFIFTLTINIFLFHTTRLTRMQANNMQVAVDKYRVDQAGILDFWNKLRNYSMTHPDYAPIMNKYSQFITVRSNGVPVLPAKK